MSETIKVTNNYIAKVMPVVINGQLTQNPVVESLKKKRIPTKVQYWSRRALDKIAQFFKTFEETRQELVKQHGKKDEDGELLIVMKDAAKIKPLMDNPETKDIPEVDGTEMTKAIKNEGISVKTAEAISKWSEGKISAEDNGDIVIENMADLQKDINDLLEEEVDLGINLIKVDFEEWDKTFVVNSKGEKVYRYDLITGEEMDLLWLMLDIE